MSTPSAEIWNEAELIARCRKKDAAAQKIVFTRYAGEMTVLCLRYIARQEEAKEVMMDGFLRFFNNLDSFTWRGEGSARAWLQRITVNQCLTHLRRRNMLVLTDGDDSSYDHIPTSDNVLGQLTVREIMKMIHSLPVGYRTVFNMYVFDDMDHKEIAQTLGISESTSKSQLHRARAILKEKILQTS